VIFDIVSVGGQISAIVTELTREWRCPDNGVPIRYFDKIFMLAKSSGGEILISDARLDTRSGGVRLI
jgi:hypothetical protein